MTQEDVIKAKLDQLAEFHSQKDALEIHKKELFNEVKVPAEIEAVVSNGMKRMAAVEADIRVTAQIHLAQFDDELNSVVVPDEIKEALAELDRQRAAIVVPENIKATLAEIEQKRKEIIAKKNEHAIIVNSQIVTRKKELQAEVEGQTKDVFQLIEQRKNEIEAEFCGKSDDVEANIKKLEEEIKYDVKSQAAEKLSKNPKCKDLSIKGNFYHAVYAKARKTWIPAKLEDYTENHPDIKNCYTEGDPSISIRPV